MPAHVLPDTARAGHVVRAVLDRFGPDVWVRRLVEHEDHLLRVLRDGGLRVPHPYGVVEVRPGHEYLVVTGFVPDSVELLAAPRTDELLADALRQVRLLWAAGAAHRDLRRPTYW